MSGKFHKMTGPSRLSDLDGRRSPGYEVNAKKETKAPKRRFNPGDTFSHDGSTWELIYMYRLADKPGIWFHCIEEITKKSENSEFIQNGLITLGAGSTTPRIVFNEFRTYQDASSFFSDIYRRGSSIVMDTQTLLKLKKL